MCGESAVAFLPRSNLFQFEIKLFITQSEHSRNNHNVALLVVPCVYNKGLCSNNNNNLYINTTNIFTFEVKVCGEKRTLLTQIFYSSEILSSSVFPTGLFLSCSFNS